MLGEKGPRQMLTDGLCNNTDALAAGAHCTRTYPRDVLFEVEFVCSSVYSAVCITFCSTVDSTGFTVAPLPTPRTVFAVAGLRVCGFLCTTNTVHRWGDAQVALTFGGVPHTIPYQRPEGDEFVCVKQVGWGRSAVWILPARMHRSCLALVRDVKMLFTHG